MPKKVLVAYENQFVAEMMQTLLMVEGHPADAVTSWGQAIAMIREGSHDAVLTDCRFEKTGDKDDGDLSLKNVARIAEEAKARGMQVIIAAYQPPTLDFHRLKGVPIVELILGQSREFNARILAILNGEEENPKVNLE
jgi:CheY-like chemotaxis protein